MLEGILVEKFGSDQTIAEGIFLGIFASTSPWFLTLLHKQS